MALKQLTPEQIETMSAAEKDRWWLKEVFKGDVPQFTLRAGLCGFLLGSFLSITNLYVGAKTGWTLGVGITSVILAFVVFRLLIRVGLVESYHVLENNIVQSIACSAGYMTAPLISSLAAYMLVTGTIIPWWQTATWLFLLAILGVLFAFPLKRRFINVEQHPFPEGRAAGVVMDTLHSGADPREGALTARLLLYSAATAAALQLAQSHKIMEAIYLKILSIPEYLDGWLYALSSRLGFQAAIGGIPLKELTVRPQLDIAMIGAGGLMGIRTGASLMIGATVNYCILAPIIINHGDIEAVITDGVATYGFRQITKWALWGGVAMMTTASLFSFFSKPALLISAFKGIFGGRQSEEEDCLRDIELPMKVFVIGIPIVGLLTVLLAHWYFDVSILMGILAVPMVFVFTLIGVNSTALTSITPTGALGKLTQLTYGVLAPGNIKTNLMTAGITGEVASNASNLIMNIKPGYMLGGKPRLQALGHSLGAISGAITSVLVFYPLFLRGDPDNLVSDQYPMPAALIWKAVAELLTQGLDQLPTTAVWAAAIGAIVGILMEVVRLVTKGKLFVSAIGIGLAFVIPFATCLAMAFGAFVFWLLGRRYSDEEHKMNRVFVKNQDSICAGIIAGAALMGIAVMAIELFVLK